MISRRQLIAGAAVSSVAFPAHIAFGQVATPMATPVASVPRTADVLPAWLEAQAALTAQGEAVSAAFWAHDAAAIAAVGSPELAAAITADADIEAVIAAFTGRQVQFAFPEVGAWFFGQYTPELISGMFFQGGAITWQAAPDEPQTGDAPTGTWTGAIDPAGMQLGISLEFSGTPDALAVNLSIPTQMLLNAPMSDVVLHTDLVIGDMIDQRSIPAGGEVTIINNYAEQYAWGDHSLVLDSWWNGEGQLIGLTLIPQPMLAEQSIPAIRARLPFDGAWLVVWGGETIFRNYHAATPQQRYATDIVVWQNGSTAVSPGTEPSNYHAFGQPYLAPVSGTIAAVMDGLEDITPQGPANPQDNPAGNHVVIETEGGFVFLAHCMNGSVQVAVGDSVNAGDVVAKVGNSGNTSEPHVHIHAQTHLELFDPAATGIPLVFENVMVNGELVAEMSPLYGTIIEQSS